MKAGILILSMIAIGCSQPQTEKTHYNIDVEASDDLGNPIEGIEISIGETRIGSVGQDGHLKTRVAASDGQRFAFHATCPSGYSSQKIPKEVVFRDSYGLDNTKNSSLKFQIECFRNNRMIALLVHAQGYPGVPISVDGKPVGMTGSDGFGHFRLDRAPGTQLEVSIDGSSLPHLLSNNPKQTVVLGSEDEIFIYNPEFIVKKTPILKKKRRRRKRKQVLPVVVAKKRPIRIN